MASALLFMQFVTRQQNDGKNENGNEHKSRYLGVCSDQNDDKTNYCCQKDGNEKETLIINGQGCLIINAFVLRNKNAIDFAKISCVLLGCDVVL